MHLPDNIALFIEKYLNGTISPEERSLLDQWYNSLANNKTVLVPGSKDEQEINGRLQRRIFNTIHPAESNTRLQYQTARRHI